MLKQPILIIAASKTKNSRHMHVHWPPQNNNSVYYGTLHMYMTNIS